MKLDDDLLVSALKIYNDHTMSTLPDIIDQHNFSRRFERRMERLKRAHKKFKGSLGIERFHRYTTRIAMVIFCFSIVNIVSINAFDLDIWNTVYRRVDGLMKVQFTAKKENETVVNVDTKLKIVSVPEEYQKQDEYFSEDMSVQNFRSDDGTITYTEGLITENADVNITVKKSKSADAKVEEEKKISVGAKEVTLCYGTDHITAFFKDNKYYHIIEVQGKDANEKFVTEIIQKLEAQ